MDLFVICINESFHRYVFRKFVFLFIALVFKNELIQLSLYFLYFEVGNSYFVHFFRTHVFNVGFEFFHLLFSSQWNHGGIAICKVHFFIFKAATSQIATIFYKIIDVSFKSNICCHIVLVCFSNSFNFVYKTFLFLHLFSSWHVFLIFLIFCDCS